MAEPVQVWRGTHSAPENLFGPLPGLRADGVVAYEFELPERFEPWPGRSRLAFLIERSYVPYIKWFGSAFKRLRCASDLGPHLEGALSASDWRAREAHLVRAYEDAARMHNALGVTDPVSEEVASFHGRPYLVIHADRFVEAVGRAITSEVVRAWPPRIGSVNQWADATDVLDRPSLLERLRLFYDAPDSRVVQQ